MKKPKILIIDDDKIFLETFKCISDSMDFEFCFLSSAVQALEFLKKEKVNLIITDVVMPEMNGIELFQKAQDLYPHIPFIMITAFGSTEKAVQAVKQGAFHYFEKPIINKLEIFSATMREAIQKGKLQKEISQLRLEKLLRSQKQASIIGCSKGINQVSQAISEMAQYPVSVLIYGETGTGKGLVARAIYNQSERREGPFIKVNCSAYAEGILESELFGHEKGAFTSAVAQKPGIFELADNGTLFLDEISESSLFLQPKLLSVLESGEFCRVGGTEVLTSNFRLITATNRDLRSAVEAGKFREDLFYRLNVCMIEIPPLRNRLEDIPLIAEYYLKQFVNKHGRRIDGFAENAMLSLREYAWPGNVRELRNIIERAVIVSKNPLITTRDLPFSLQKKEYFSTSLRLEEMEKYCVMRALKQTGNNKTEAAKMLGISRKTLIQKNKKYNFSEFFDN